MGLRTTCLRPSMPGLAVARPGRSLKRIVPNARTATSEIEIASSHASFLREQFVSHNLEAITPYMSELSVVKAVVRQHQAKLAWEKKEAERSKDPSSSAYYSQGSYDGFSNSYGADPAPSEQYIQDYNTFNYVDRPAGSYGPPCPVPGVTSSPPPTHPPSRPSSSGNGSYAWAAPDAAPYSQATPYSSSPAPESWPPRPRSPTPSGTSMHAAAAAAAPPDFLAILDASASQPGQQLMDSYAMRHLILSRPAQLEPLSSVMLSADSFVQRCLSTSLWGERCVLTFTLKRRSEQELKSTYSKQPHKQPWVLGRVAGEPLSAEPLEAISPEHPPEAIVAAQLQAFKDCDFDVAYALTSPVGRAVAGTRERFKASLQADFRYQQLLMHRSATSLQRAHNAANTYLEVFSVDGLQGGSSLYIWVATRQLEGLYKNCWLVEYVTPVIDPEIVKVLQMGY